MASIIDLPDFMFNYSNKKYNKVSKILYTFFGLIIGLIHRKAFGKIFCNSMNLFFNKDGKIFYEEDMYYKKIWTGHKFFYPNKRIDRLIINHKKHFDLLFNTYCLDELSFKKNEIVIDCGANVGELFISLIQNNSECNYIAFEPDPITFKSLERNLIDYGIKIYDCALSNENENKDLYLDTDGADTSLIYFGSDRKVNVNVKTLDSFNIKGVKLLKIEAEGAELEVLEGAKETLKYTEYVTVDYGPERGISKLSTSAEIVNFLYENNFKLIKVSKFRQVGLFKRSSIKS
tara:strand:+ start:20507 stop:21373 length:867 start_codon:yes stop_codon:yes gene_type:complete